MKSAARVRYEGEFELAWLRDGERVMSAGDGTGAAIVVSPDGSELRIDIGGEIKVQGTGAREAEGSGLLSRPADDRRVGSNPTPSASEPERFSGASGQREAGPTGNEGRRSGSDQAAAKFGESEAGPDEASSIRQPDSPIQPSAANTTWESHWLIERPVEGETHPVYWSGKGWTPDPWQAKRFVTEAEANRAIRSYLHPFVPSVVEAKAVSHGFEVSLDTPETRPHGIIGADISGGPFRD